MAKYSRLVDRLRKEAVDPELTTVGADIGRSRDFLDKLPSVDTTKLYKDQSKSMYEGYEELKDIDKDATEANEVAAPKRRSDSNTPGSGAQKAPDIKTPELSSPNYAVAPPTGNVFPNERPVNVSQGDDMNKQASEFPAGFGLRRIASTAGYNGNSYPSSIPQSYAAAALPGDPANSPNASSGQGISSSPTSSSQQSGGAWETAKKFGKWYAKDILDGVYDFQTNGLGSLMGNNPYTKIFGLDDDSNKRSKS